VCRATKQRRSRRRDKRGDSEKPRALITGAGIGIGVATAHAFAGAGYRLIVTTYWRKKAVCRAGTPAMREVGRGSMIAVSSIVGVAYG
jgi:NAD(P)-dependent dehydrogenase (short-subunit alcohol dehydrogenase family)